jgi:hypothetical protein
MWSAVLALLATGPAMGRVLETDFDTGAPAGSQAFGSAVVADFRTITSQDFDGGGTPYTAVQRNTAPGATVTSGGPTGDFMRLATAVNNQRNTIAFDRVLDRAVARYESTWDYRIAPGSAVGGSGRADGLGLTLLDTGTHGTIGGGPDYFGETPSVADSFGLALDIHQGSEPNNNHTSLHWDSAQVGGSLNPSPGVDLANQVFNRAVLEIEHVVGGANVSLSITPDIHGTPSASVTPYTDFFIPGMGRFESRLGFGARTGGQNAQFDLDNISSVQQGGIENGSLRLTDAVGSQSAGFALPQIDPDPYVLHWEAEFDFRVAPNPPGANGADGWSLSLVRDSNVGTAGENGNGSGVTFGFDTYNNGGEISENHLSLLFDGALIAEVDLLPTLTVEDGLVHHARLAVQNGTAFAYITPAGGTQTMVLGPTAIPGWTPYNGRFLFGARTGGSFEEHFIDNLRIETTTPEPTTTGLLLLGGVGWLARRRRRR